MNPNKSKPGSAKAVSKAKHAAASKAKLGATTRLGKAKELADDLNGYYVSRLTDDEKQQLAKELGDLGHVVLSEGYNFIDFEFYISATAMNIYAEESGTPELVAEFLQQYLEKFQPQGSLWFAWATTCSKMRAGEFGGGAAFITATDIKFLDTHSWAEEQAKKLAA